MKKILTILITNAFALISFAQSISYDYDYAGRVSLIQYPNGQTIRYSYDASGNRTFKENDVPCGLIPSPVITSFGTTSFCPGDSVVLSAAMSVDLTYQWRKNGRNIAGATNANYSATASGIYKVVVTYVTNCIDSSNGINVTVYPKPNVGFTINTASQCLTGNNFILSDTSVISTGSLIRFWAFGDGDTATTINPRKTYLTSGTYNIRLLETSLLGCKDSLSKTVTVKPQSPATITATNSSSFCSGGNVTLKADTGTGLTYQWKLNGINISGANAITYTSSVTGNYTVVTTNSFGCKDTSNTISTGANARPVSGFKVNNNVQCKGGNNFIFTDTTSIISGTLTRSWTFGDGDTSTSVIHAKTYNTAGTFTVKLVSTSSAGCKDSVSKTVTVNPPPIATIAGSDSVRFCPGQSAILSADTGTGFTYQWRKNGVNIAGAINLNYTATTAGAFKVVVTNAKGCSDSSRAVNVILNAIPNTGFSINNATQCLSGNNFVFNDTTSAELSRKWDLGTGDSSLLKNAVKTFGATGTFTIKLFATGLNGCKDSAIKTVVVNPKPTAAFSINNATQCLIGNNFIFTDNSSISSGILSRNWNFGNSDTSVLITKNITYTNALIYTIKLVSISSAGCKDSLTKNVTINPSPNTGFTINNPSQCFNTNYFVFNDTSNISSGSIIRTWDFGDATNGVINPATKSYNQSNTFSVNLISISNKGCQNSVTKTVTISPVPVSGFTVNNLQQCLSGNNFLFTDLSSISSGTILRKWSFGDGDSSSLLNPFKIYNTPGIYTVKLLTVSDNGCKDSSTKNLTILYSSPVVIQTSRGTGSFCTNDSVVLNAISGSMNTYQWLENGVIIPSATQANLVVKQTGNYQVIASNANSCTDTSAVFTTTNVLTPVVGNIIGPLQINSLLTTATYSVAAQPGHLYYWTLVGANILSGQGTNALTVQWVLRGMGRIRIKMVNSTGCFDTTLININVTTGLTSVFEDNSIELYPNPASEQFTVSSLATEMQTITVYDSRGRLLLSKDIYAKEANIDVVSYSAGMYMVEVKTASGVKNFKLIKD
ncbi:MAG: T9SS type A sorting domain-containing protein [Bacteroidia bacterium]|nr:T9SS type A sorting domain-containing protein [Bacteroidia bacterium]